MIRSYVKFAFRNLYKNKTYSIISICGLAVGLAAFVLLSLYVRHENNWDTFNENYERIYRVEQMVTKSTGETAEGTVPAPVGPALNDQFPEVIDSVRLFRTWIVSLSASKEKTFLEKYRTGYYADNSLFRIFTFDFVNGTAQNALAEPYSMVITEDTAEKYFPGQNPLGKTLNFDGRFDCKVTGVVKNPPPNSHFKYRFFLSMETLKAREPDWNFSENWNDGLFFNYILLKDQKSAAPLARKIDDFLEKHRDRNRGTYLGESRLYLKPLKDLHFSQTEFEVDDNTDRIVSFLFGAIAAFILLVACINFMNLSTAYSVTRAKEIGVRKVVGGGRLSLMGQFLGESVLVSLLSLMMAVMLVEIFLPIFNGIVRRELEFHFLTQWPFSGLMLLLAPAVGVLSGIYPAMVLSSFEPAKVFKGVAKFGDKKALFSKVLIVFQFAISFILICSTALTFRQLDYIKNKDLGIDTRSVLAHEFSHPPGDVQGKYDALKNELLKSPYVSKASVSRRPLLVGYDHRSITWEGAPPGETMKAIFNVIDYDFTGIYGIEIKEGRGFSKDFPSDKDNACLINETAVNDFGWKSAADAVGKKVYYEGKQPFTVIGVVRDFHMYTLFRPIQSLVMFSEGGKIRGGTALTLKLDGENPEEGKAVVARKFEEFFPGELIDLVFIEENFDGAYRDVLAGVGKTFGFFSFLTIFIAAIGLFSLVSFSTNRRTKEIGVRKALGASIARIFLMLVKQYLVLLGIAVAIAWPATYFFFEKVLHVMTYSGAIQLWPFLLAAFISLLIVFITVSFKAVQAARANPVKALRYE